MELKDQLVSLELSKRLKELGVKQESLFLWDEVWSQKEGDGYELFYKDTISQFEKLPDGAISAFTVSELGEMLKDIDWPLPDYGTDAWYAYGDNEDNPDIKAKTEADARAKLLIYLLENKLINS